MPAQLVLWRARWPASSQQRPGASQALCVCCKHTPAEQVGRLGPQRRDPRANPQGKESIPFLAGAASFLRLSPDGICPLALLSAATRASKSLSVGALSPSAAPVVCQCLRPRNNLPRPIARKKLGVGLAAQ